MKDELKKLYVQENDIFGLPQEYKGFLLNPILLKDTKYQELFYKIFCHPKNYIPSVDVLKSSYLKFLIYVLSDAFGSDGREVVESLIDMLSYIFKVEKSLVNVLYRKLDDSQGLSSIELRIKVGDLEFTEDDFDNIREIVLEQNNNSIEYIESYNPELEPSLAFMNRNNEDMDLKDQIFTFCALTKISLNEIKNYTIYQFSNLIERVMVLKEYDLYKPLVVSGQITVKDGEIKHYLYHSRKGGRYDSIMVNPDTFMEKNKDAFG